MDPKNQPRKRIRSDGEQGPGPPSDHSTTVSAAGHSTRPSIQASAPTPAPAAQLGNRAGLIDLLNGVNPPLPPPASGAFPLGAPPPGTNAPARRALRPPDRLPSGGESRTGWGRGGPAPAPPSSPGDALLPLGGGAPPLPGGSGAAAAAGGGAGAGAAWALAPGGYAGFGVTGNRIHPISGAEVEQAAESARQQRSSSLGQGSQMLQGGPYSAFGQTFWHSHTDQSHSPGQTGPAAAAGAFPFAFPPHAHAPQQPPPPGRRQQPQPQPPPVPMQAEATPAAGFPALPPLGGGGGGGPGGAAAGAAVAAVAPGLPAPQRALALALGLPKALFHRVVRYLPLPRLWATTLVKLRRRCHIDPNEAVRGGLGIIDEVLTDLRISRARAQELHLVLLARDPATQYLLRAQYRMPDLLFGWLAQWSDVQSILARVDRGVNFTPPIAIQVVALASELHRWYKCHENYTVYSTEDPNNSANVFFSSAPGGGVIGEGDEGIGEEVTNQVGNDDNNTFMDEESSDGEEEEG